MFFCVCPRSRSVRWSNLEHAAEVIIFVFLLTFFFWSKRLRWSFSKVPSILPIAQKEEEKEEVHWTLTFEKFCF